MPGASPPARPRSTLSPPPRRRSGFYPLAAGHYRFIDCQPTITSSLVGDAPSAHKWQPLPSFMPHASAVVMSFVRVQRPQMTLWAVLVSGLSKPNAPWEVTSCKKLPDIVSLGNAANLPIPLLEFLISRPADAVNTASLGLKEPSLASCILRLQLRPFGGSAEPQGLGKAPQRCAERRDA